MFSNILFILIIFCSFDLIINYKVPVNFIGKQKLKNNKSIGLPSLFKGKTFYKNAKTSEGNDELVCKENGNGYCKKYSINSIYCGPLIRDGPSFKVECSTSDTPFLIQLDNPKLFCKGGSPLPGMEPLFDLDTCYLQYSLAWNWLYTILIIAGCLLFTPCLIGLVFYFGLMTYVKLFKKKKVVYNTTDNPYPNQI